MEDVIIVGAGPVGLSLAYHLARNGIKSQIIELKGEHKTRKAEEKAKSKALAVHMRTMELLSLVGITSKLIEKGIPLEGIGLEDGTNLITTEHIDSTTTEYPYILSVPQFVTESVLLEECINSDVKFLWDTKVINVKQDDEKVYITVVPADEDENSTKKKVLVSRYIVGSDGPSSSVRQAAGIDFNGEDVRRTFVMADCKCDFKVPPNKLYLIKDVDPKSDLGFTIFIPQKDDICRIIFQFPDSMYEDFPKEPEEEFFQKECDKRHPGFVKLSDFTWRTKFRCRQRVCNSYQKDRLFLAGDSAHSHTPLGGQGMNTGIHDTTNIAWKLGMALTNKLKDPKSFLETYNQERLPIATNLVKLTGESAVNNVTILSKMVTFAQTLIHNLPLVGTIIVARAGMLDLNYRNSSICTQINPSLMSLVMSYPLKVPSQITGFSVHSGDRAPEGRLELLDNSGKYLETVKLYKYLGKVYPQHTLIVFLNDLNLAKEASEVLSFVENISFINSVTLLRNNIVPSAVKEKTQWAMDTHEELWRRYSFSGNQIVLIRPDAYIGFIADLKSSQFKEYLEKLYVL